ncbi:MAG: response regulator, partial [Acidimicrobiales bacterium]
MSQPLRVLIVEDRPSDAEALALRLEEEGFEPRWVRVDAEAAYLAELAVAPDLILSDWTLPHFSGLRALRSVRGRGMDTPFVIVSGSVGEETAIDAMHEGADDYVLKDRLARLGPAVRRALDNRRSRDDRRRADAQLRQAAMVFESSNEAITLTDVDGTIVAVNRAFTEITGYVEAEVLGRNPSILQSGRQDQGFYRDLWMTLAATGRWRGEIWNRRKNGEVYPEWLTISA